MSTSTPETDAEVICAGVEHSVSAYLDTDYVPAKFARQLERQRDELLTALHAFMPNGQLLVREGHITINSWRSANAAIIRAAISKLKVPA